MKLVTGHVKIGEVVVLLLDLDVAVGEVFVLFLDFLEPLADAPVFLGELLHLRAQPLHLIIEARRPLGFERGQAIPQALILPQQLLGEFLALVEQLEKLLSSFFGHGGLSRTTNESSTRELRVMTALGLRVLEVT